MNYAEYYTLNARNGPPHVGLLLLLDPQRSATRIELHIPEGEGASTIAHGLESARQMLRERSDLSWATLPFYVLEMQEESTDAHPGADGERSGQPGGHGVRALQGPVAAEYFDLEDGDGHPLAGLLVLLDEAQQPTRAKIYVADGVDPAVNNHALDAAYRELQQRYHVGTEELPHLTLLSVVPRGASTIEAAPPPSSTPSPQWTSPVDRSPPLEETPAPQPKEPVRMEKWLPYVAFAVIAVGVMLGAWTLTALLDRNRSGALSDLPMAETHQETNLTQAAVVNPISINPVSAVATDPPQPVATPHLRDTYCIWPRETLSEIALHAGVIEDAIRAQNPKFTGNAGTTIELPPGSILPAAWDAPLPFVPTIDAIPFGVSGYYIGYDNRRKRVALSFDVGFVEGNQELMESLAEQGIRATFFVLGGAVENHPEMIGHILDNGHELGNHSYTHDNMLKMSADEIRWELSFTEELVQNAYRGATTKPIFRAPFGAINDTVTHVAREEGYHVIGWTVDSRDWTDEITADALYERVTNLVCPGAIIALHDVNPASAVALPRVLAFLRDNGYEFVTVGEILFPPRS